MNRDRFFDWAETQLAHFAEEGASVECETHMRWVSIGDARTLGFEAHEDGTVRVYLGTASEDVRRDWSDLFRDVRSSEPPWPPGPSPAEIGELELSSDASGRQSRLHFSWMFLGTNFLQELPSVVAAMSWLLLAGAELPHEVDSIELDDT